MGVCCENGVREPAQMNDKDPERLQPLGVQTREIPGDLAQPHRGG